MRFRGILQSMTLDALIMLAGALVAALPFLGFPNSWDSVLLFLIGVFIVALGIIVRRRMGHQSSSSESRDTSVESSPRFGGGHEEV